MSYNYQNTNSGLADHGLIQPQN